MGNSYVQIMIEALTKKAVTLSQIVAACDEQENCLKSTPLQVDRYKELVNVKNDLAGEIQKIDDGFVSVYDRVSEELKDHKEEYQIEIKKIQELIKKITDLTNSVSTKETRIAGQAKNIAGLNQVKQKKVTATYGNVANKYANVMNKTIGQGSVFINQKQ